MSLELSGTTGVKGVAGSVSAPSIVGDDTNTGISFPAADTIKFSTGGVERIVINNSGISGTGISSAGLTMADQHRIPSLFTMATSDTVLTNFERVDSDGAGTFGTGMTQSSGIFTFPSTGIYLIHYFFTAFSNSGSDTNQVQIALQTTTDNSTYGNAAFAVGSLDYQYDRKSIYSTFMFDVTDTSTHKVRFRQYSSGGSIYSLGESVESYNAFTFLRMGDT